MTRQAIYLVGLLAAVFSSCQQLLFTGKSNFKITRLRCKNSNASPSIFGVVYVKGENGVHQWPGPIVQADEGIVLHVKNDGSYKYSLPSGQHKLIAGQVGYSVVKINRLFLKTGDSIRVDFLLHTDTTAGMY